MKSRILSFTLAAGALAWLAAPQALGQATNRDRKDVKELTPRVERTVDPGKPVTDAPTFSGRVVRADLAARTLYLTGYPGVGPADPAPRAKIGEGPRLSGRPSAVDRRARVYDDPDVGDRASVTSPDARPEMALTVRVSDNAVVTLDGRQVPLRDIRVGHFVRIYTRPEPVTGSTSELRTGPPANRAAPPVAPERVTYGDRVIGFTKMPSAKPGEMARPSGGPGGR